MQRRPLLLTPFLRGLLALALLLPAVLRAADTSPSEALQNYKLQPMDLVRVQVFQESDLDRELRIPADGVVDFPLIGKVSLKNRSVREVQASLTDLYRKDYLVNPQVNVSVLEYASRSVNVLGAVNSSGAVPIPPESDLTLLDAIARSGGFSRLANRSKVSITRTLPGGRTENFVVNADQVVTGEAGKRWPLVNGDVIYVPERVL